MSWIHKPFRHGGMCNKRSEGHDTAVIGPLDIEFFATDVTSGKIAFYDYPGTNFYGQEPIANTGAVFLAQGDATIRLGVQTVGQPDRIIASSRLQVSTQIIRIEFVQHALFPTEPAILFYSLTTGANTIVRVASFTILNT